MKMRVKLILLRVGSVITGLVYIFSSNKVEFHDHVIFALLLFCAEQLMEQGFVGHLGVSDLSSIKRWRGLTGKIVSRLHGKIREIEGHDEDYYDIKHPDLAIWSYDEFWRTLVQVQRSLRERDRLTVQAIHSCQMNIWTNHHYARRIVESQRQFIEDRGTVIRILCGQGDFPGGEVAKAAIALVNIGVKVRYYNVETAIVNHTFSWDFLRVQPGGDAVIWAAPGGVAGGVIDKARYTKSEIYESTKIDDLWNDLLDASKELAVSDQGLIFKPSVDRGAR